MRNRKALEARWAEFKAAEKERDELFVKHDVEFNALADSGASEAELDALEDKRDAECLEAMHAVTKAWKRWWVLQFPEPRNEWFRNVVNGFGEIRSKRISAKQVDAFSRYCEEDDNSWRSHERYCRVGELFVKLNMRGYITIERV